MQTSHDEFREIESKTAKHGAIALGLFAATVISEKIMPGVSHKVLYEGGNTPATIFTIGQGVLAASSLGEAFHAMWHALDGLFKAQTNEMLADLYDETTHQPQ